MFPHIVLSSVIQSLSRILIIMLLQYSWNLKSALPYIQLLFSKQHRLDLLVKRKHRSNSIEALKPAAMHGIGCNHKNQSHKSDMGVALQYSNLMICPKCEWKHNSKPICDLLRAINYIFWKASKWMIELCNETISSDSQECITKPSVWHSSNYIIIYVACARSFMTFVRPLWQTMP